MLRQKNLLPVANRTVRKFERRLNVIFPYELPAGRLLIRWRLPAHREHLFARAEELFWMPVTGETPLHVHVCGFPGQRHSIHASVAGFTADAFVDVDAVIEVDKVGKIVYSIPPKGLVLTQARTDGFEHFAVSPDLLVTIHARRCWRNTRKGAHFNGVVAIPAVDPESAHMMRMTERNRLIKRDSFVGNVRRINGSRPTPGDSSNYEDTSEYRQPRDGVRCSFEYLRHGVQYSADSRAASTLPEETRPVLGLFESYVSQKRLADTTRWNDSANRRLSAAAVKRREPTAFQCVELKEQ